MIKTEVLLDIICPWGGNGRFLEVDPVPVPGKGMLRVSVSGFEIDGGCSVKEGSGPGGFVGGWPQCSRRRLQDHRPCTYRSKGGW